MSRDTRQRAASIERTKTLTTYDPHNLLLDSTSEEEDDDELEQNTVDVAIHNLFSQLEQRKQQQQQHVVELNHDKNPPDYNLLLDYIVQAAHRRESAGESPFRPLSYRLIKDAFIEFAKSNNISPDASNTGTLYEKLHQAIKQIHASDGDDWLEKYENFNMLIEYPKQDSEQLRNLKNAVESDKQQTFDQWLLLLKATERSKLIERKQMEIYAVALHDTRLKQKWFDNWRTQLHKNLLKQESADTYTAHRVFKRFTNATLQIDDQISQADALHEKLLKKRALKTIKYAFDEAQADKLYNYRLVNRIFQKWHSKTVESYTQQEQADSIYDWSLASSVFSSMRQHFAKAQESCNLADAIFNTETVLNHFQLWRTNAFLVPKMKVIISKRDSNSKRRIFMEWTKKTNSILDTMYSQDLDLYQKYWRSWTLSVLCNQFVQYREYKSVANIFKMMQLEYRYKILSAERNYKLLDKYLSKMKQIATLQTTENEYVDSVMNWSLASGCFQAFRATKEDKMNQNQVAEDINTSTLVKHTNDSLISKFHRISESQQLAENLDRKRLLLMTYKTIETNAILSKEQRLFEMEKNLQRQRDLNLKRRVMAAFRAKLTDSLSDTPDELAAYRAQDTAKMHAQGLFSQFERIAQSEKLADEIQETKDAEMTINVLHSWKDKTLLTEHLSTESEKINNGSLIKSTPIIARFRKIKEDEERADRLYEARTKKRYFQISRNAYHESKERRLNLMADELISYKDQQLCSTIFQHLLTLHRSFSDTNQVADEIVAEKDTELKQDVLSLLVDNFNQIEEVNTQVTEQRDSELTAQTFYNLVNHYDNMNANFDESLYQLERSKLTGYLSAWSSLNFKTSLLESKGDAQIDRFVTATKRRTLRRWRKTTILQKTIANPANDIFESNIFENSGVQQQQLTMSVPRLNSNRRLLRGQVSKTRVVFTAPRPKSNSEFSPLAASMRRLNLNDNSPTKSRLSIVTTRNSSTSSINSQSLKSNDMRSSTSQLSLSTDPTLEGTKSSTSSFSSKTTEDDKNEDYFVSNDGDDNDTHTPIRESQDQDLEYLSTPSKSSLPTTNTNTSNTNTTTTPRLAKRHTLTFAEAKSRLEFLRTPK